MDALTRFVGYIRDMSTKEICWEWTGAIHTTGYGVFNFKRKTYFAHRWIYATIVEDILEGYVIDHLCHNKCCVNPTHLEMVTREENNRRAHRSAKGWRKSHCIHGHPRTAENLYANGSCRVCLSIKQGFKLHYYNKAR